MERESNTFRVVRRSSKGKPDHWGVQRAFVQVDGRILWRLATDEHFWSADGAATWIQMQKGSHV